MKPPDEVDAVSFDRDLTVGVGVAPGPVPLEWVAQLAADGPAVYAHGNQLLVDEAGAIGLEQVADQADYPFFTHPEVALSRLERLHLIGELHPDATVCYAVDDAFKLGVEPRDVPEPWAIFTPEEFVQQFRGHFEWEEPSNV